MKPKNFTSYASNQQCCSKAKDVKVEVKAKDFKFLSRPRTQKSRPKPSTTIKDKVIKLLANKTMTALSLLMPTILF